MKGLNTPWTLDALLSLPFFEPRHNAWVARLQAGLPGLPAHGPEVAASAQALDDHCRALALAMGQQGWLAHVVAGRAHGAAADQLDTREICLARDVLAAHDPLADFVLAMQGLGSGALVLQGSASQQARWLPGVVSGTTLAAFALSEPQAGSDVAAMQCWAEPVEGGYRLHGEKTWISNGGIAGFYVLFARLASGPLPEGGAWPRGTRDIAAFVVPADAPGLEVARRLDVLAPHPLAHLTLDGVRVQADALLAGPGDGFKLAMRTLDIFRSSVAAAALGMARRAMQAAVTRCLERPMLGGVLADQALVQQRLAEMAVQLDSASLLTYRAAWWRDQGVPVTQAAAMAKLTATEQAQQVIDQALQLHGGLGLLQGEVTEQLYREIRALRIYEGATEVQWLIIARELLKEARL